ncbi:MAG: sugar transferase [bacterium]|nr:sugar transferase [bacterium]
MYPQVIKPILDWLLALMLVVLATPLMIGIMAILRLTQRHVFYVQERPGNKEEVFNMYKFRTLRYNDMDDESPSNNFTKFLRKSSLDELPQLINVLKGEMSFVGPRPLLKEYLELYSETHKKRHDVKPGITGLAQVNGRNLISWEERLDLDYQYTKKISFLLDLKIVLLTFRNLFLKPDMGSSITMPRFKGYQ